jgi:3',5'-cyclic AMP phosphodiesterase CpdA
MLDTNDVSTYKYPQGSVPDKAAEAALKQLAGGESSNSRPWNGAFGADQLAWLDKALAAAGAAQEPVILCGHHPLLPATGHQAWNSGEVLARIEGHACVRAYLCGHNHAGDEVIAKGIPYITFKSILHEPGVTAFAVLRLFKDRLVIEGRGREKSRVIPLPVLPS